MFVLGNRERRCGQKVCTCNRDGIDRAMPCKPIADALSNETKAKPNQSKLNSIQVKSMAWF